MDRRRKLLYSLGSVAANLPSNAFSTYVIFFYVDVLKVPAMLTALGMLIYGIWNAINDPVLGHISDRTRTRWGRRIPYILWGTLPLAVAFVLIWTPPFRVEAGETGKLFAWFLGTILAFDGLYTLVILNWTSLFPEMYPTLAERAEVSAWRQFFGILAMIVAIALPPVLYGVLGWPAMAAIFGVIIALSLGLSLLGSAERPENQREEGLALLPALRYTLANRSFITYVLGSFFFQFTTVLLLGTIPFYAKYVLGIEGTWTTLMLGLIFVGILLTLVFWMRRAVRRGARRTVMESIAVFGLFLVPFWFARGFIGGAIAAFLLGLGLGGVMILLDVLISDVIDEDEVRTGRRREGMYFGVNAFIIRLGISLQAVILGTVLKLTGYDAHAAVQTSLALTGLRLLISVIPLGAICLSLLFFRLYPLHGEALARVKEEIARRRAEA